MPLHLLLAEDEEIAAENLAFLLRKRLKSRDIHVHLARGGKEALDIVAGRPDISVALLDVRMPGMDGIELTHKLRQSRPDLECIMLSGYDTPVCRMECRRWGARAFLSKPAKIDEIVGAIEEAALAREARPACSRESALPV